jgi:FMN-dependent oxidoreductase (nitrilotriacetate monooxygenase family)
MSGTPPYLAVRRITTLDYMSGGRVGWNIVTGLLRAEHRAMGTQPVAHDRRYDMADEYMDVCYALWDGLEDGAIVVDRETGTFADPDRVRFVSHHGEFYNCDAVPPVMKANGMRPVLFQAGSSGRGMEFAQKHADYVFAIQPDLERMKEYQARANAKVLFGIQPIIGSTEEEAARKVREWTERVPIDAALSKMSGTVGIDLSKFDLDTPLEEMETNTSQGMMKTLAASFGGKRRTLREVARETALSVLLQIAGTPEQIADKMEHLWRESGAHGFNISPNVTPGSITDFVDQVVPLLQKRGVFRTRYEGSNLRETLG